MKKLYSSQNRVFLYLLKACLEDKKINCFFKNESPPAAGEVPPMIAWPEIWIMNDSDFAAATECVEAELARPAAAAWQCPKCHEKLEGQFEICWKCGYERQDI
jgi:hypothetical protein